MNSCKKPINERSTSVTSYNGLFHEPAQKSKSKTIWTGRIYHSCTFSWFSFLGCGKMFLEYFLTIRSWGVDIGYFVIFRKPKPLLRNREDGGRPPISILAYDKGPHIGDLTSLRKLSAQGERLVKVRACAKAFSINWFIERLSKYLQRRYAWNPIQSSQRNAALP